MNTATSWLLIVVVAIRAHVLDGDDHGVWISRLATRVEARTQRLSSTLLLKQDHSDPERGKVTRYRSGQGRG